MVSIVQLDLADVILTVTWDDGVVTEYPWIWLRDHAHDDATIHPDTQQRQLFTAGLDPSIRGASAEVRYESLEVTWADGSGVSELPVEFLADYRRAGQRRAAIEINPVLWDAEMLGGEPPSVPYEEVMDSDAGVDRWLRTVGEFGFCFATGTPATLDANLRMVKRIGYVRETIFGGFWDFEADLARADTAYTNLELLGHTDGTYSHDAPGLQLLHCIYFDGSGGESTMVDGFRIASELRTNAPQHFETLSRVVVPGRYLGDGSNLLAARPVFRHDHTGALTQVSFNNSDRAPFLLPADEMIAFYDALRAFEQLANDSRLMWSDVLRPGNAMLFDNWRVLHGRRAYTGRRHLCGAYINHEDFESQVRIGEQFARRVFRLSGRPEVIAS
jgi:trimethyllysine dioxygenase